MMGHDGSGPQELETKESLHADCARCTALCCVGLAFKASEEFAFDKPSGTPCRNLVGGRSCGIHGQLRSAGYRGCATYDCFGAGQHVTAHTCAGIRWEDGGDEAATLFAVFDVMRRLKEFLWHLADAARVAGTTDLGHEVAATRNAVQALVWEPSTALEKLNVLVLQDRVLELLAQVSGAHRAGLDACSDLLLAAGDLRHADLNNVNLRGADLRYARLDNATLAGADLTGADVLGSDLRGSDLRGAHLAASLYLTQMQVEAAQGDEATTLPEGIRRPAHWEVPASSEA